MNIEGKAKGKLDVKRCYLPGIVMSDECPRCKLLVIDDLSNRPLNYPVMNEPFTYMFYCCGCDEEWEHEVTLNISLEKAND